MYNLQYDALLDAIATRFGISLHCFNSGGGCLVWEARLESGHWLEINDWDQGIQTRARRLASEAAGAPVGWFIGIYCPAGDTPPWSHDSWRVASVSHRTATADELPDLIDLALRGITAAAHHVYDAHGAHTVTHGIDTMSGICTVT